MLLKPVPAYKKNLYFIVRTRLTTPAARRSRSEWWRCETKNLPWTSKKASSIWVRKLRKMSETAAKQIAVEVSREKTSSSSNRKNPTRTRWKILMKLFPMTWRLFYWVFSCVFMRFHAFSCVFMRFQFMRFHAFSCVFMRFQFMRFHAFSCVFMRFPKTSQWLQVSCFGR